MWGAGCRGYELRRHCERANVHRSHAQIAPKRPWIGYQCACSTLPMSLWAWWWVCESCMGLLVHLRGLWCQRRPTSKEFMHQTSLLWRSCRVPSLGRAHATRSRHDHFELTKCSPIAVAAEGEWIQAVKRVCSLLGAEGSARGARYASQ